MSTDKRSTQAEKVLLIHILCRAICDALGRTDTGATGDTKRWQDQAWGWIFKDLENPPAPFSFEWICEHLDVDAATLRRKVKDYFDQGMRQPFRMRAPTTLQIFLSDRESDSYLDSQDNNRGMRGYRDRRSFLQ